jgi:hypothetical protein
MAPFMGDHMPLSALGFLGGFDVGSPATPIQNSHHERLNCHAVLGFKVRIMAIFVRDYLVNACYYVPGS